MRRISDPFKQLCKEIKDKVRVGENKGPGDDPATLISIGFIPIPSWENYILLSNVMAIAPDISSSFVFSYSSDLLSGSPGIFAYSSSLRLNNLQNTKPTMDDQPDYDQIHRGEFFNHGVHTFTPFFMTQR